MGSRVPNIKPSAEVQEVNFRQPGPQACAGSVLSSRAVQDVETRHAGESCHGVLLELPFPDERTCTDDQGRQAFQGHGFGEWNPHASSNPSGRRILRDSSCRIQPSTCTGVYAYRRVSYASSYMSERLFNRMVSTFEVFARTIRLT